MRTDDERMFPPGTLPGAVGALGALAAIVLVCGLIFGALLGLCDRREPVQMIPSPAAQAIATASAQVHGAQGIRVTIRRTPPITLGNGSVLGSTGFDAPESTDLPITLKPSVHRHAEDFATPDPITPPGDGWEIVIEASQSLTAAATSSAQSSASVAVNSPKILESSHGRLGVSLATMPGILAADLQLVRLDVSPVTRWLVDVPMELGLDVAGNLEAGAVGVSAGSKAFAVGGVWSRWSLTQQGYFVGLGLRF